MTHAVVFNLCKRYEVQGYMIFTDNFYTFPLLAADLQNIGTDLVGTLRIKHKGVPACLKMLNAMRKILIMVTCVMQELAMFSSFSGMTVELYLCLVQCIRLCNCYPQCQRKRAACEARCQAASSRA